MKQPEKSPSVNILPSIADTALKMGEEDGGRFLYAVTNYLLYGVIPELDGTPGLIWGAIFPNLETTRKISLGRSKGGKASKSNNPNGRRGKGAAATDGDTTAEPSDGLPMDAADSPKPQHRTAPARFAPPSVDEVQQYITAQGYAVNAANFVDFYASKGWKVGNNPMKDWRAAVRTWQRREQEHPTAQASTAGSTAAPAQFAPNERGEVNVCGIIVKLGYGERIDAAGRRTYGNGKITVPPDAPRRPANGYEWSEPLHEWYYDSF